MTSSRVLLLSDIFPPMIGGSGDVMANIYGRLHGVPVTVLAGGAHAGPTANSASLEVFRELSASTHWGILHPGGLLRHVRAFLRTRRLVGATKPAVVHCARLLPEGLAAWAIRRAGGPPYLCWAHGEEISVARGSRELRSLMTLVQRDAEGFLANSRNTSTVLQASGVPAERISVVYPGVDAVRFRPDVGGSASLRQRLAPQGETVLVTVGRLQRRKGHDLVIRALSRMRQEHSHLRYVIVGDGEERSRLESLAQEHEVGDRVAFLGSVSSDMLPVCYAAADIFVHPNRIEGLDFEGFGLVFLEAAAAGLPVIAGQTGGAPEAIDPGKTGVLVSGTDVGELVSALRRLLGNPEGRRAMGRAGRDRALSQFSWERAAELTQRVHERAAAADHVDSAARRRSEV